MRLTLSRKAMILVAVPLVFELLFVGTLGALLHEVDSERSREMHAREMVQHLNVLLRLILERVITNLVYKTIDSKSARVRFHNAGKKMKEETVILKELSANDPHEAEIMGRIDTLLRRNAERSEQVVGLAEAASRLIAVKAIIGMQSDLDELCSILQNSLDEQLDEQAARKRAQAHYRALVELVLGVGLALNILLAIVLAIYFNRGTSRRLASLMDNIVLLGREKPLNPPVDGTDEIAELDQVFRSMSETLNTVRQRERAVLEHALAAICSINVKGNVIQMNPASKTLWDIDPAALIGNPITGIVLDGDKERTAKFLERLISEQTNGTIENRIIRGNGANADVQWNVQWSENERSLFCVAHDITAEKELERIKQEFVAMVSHDLRAPLMTIQIILEMLSTGRFGQIDAEGQSRLHMAEEEVDRLMRLIKELLDLERLESGQTNLDARPTPIDQILRNAYDVVAPLAEKSSIELEIGEHENFIANCEADRIVQVLVNLIANAIKFSPSNGTISINFSADEKFVQIRIVDQGRGVPKELQEAIFERFRQVEKDDAGMKGGTGLGLAICKTIVEQHGGKIGVETPDGGGSIFWFTLPRAKQ